MEINHIATALAILGVATLAVLATVAILIVQEKLKDRLRYRPFKWWIVLIGVSVIIGLLVVFDYSVFELEGSGLFREMFLNVLQRISDSIENVSHAGQPN